MKFKFPEIRSFSLENDDPQDENRIGFGSWYRFDDSRPRLFINVKVLNFGSHVVGNPEERISRR